MKKHIPGGLIHHTRYKQLDSLRGIVALFVFFTHFLGLKGNMPLFYRLKLTPLGVLVNGNGAVMFFFVLSGFVLSLPFINAEKPLKLTAFYTKRIFRLYPAFIIAIIVSIFLKLFVFDKAAMALFTGWIDNFWNWDFDKANIAGLLKTFLLVGPQFNVNLIDPPIWSLIIEVKMSVVLPLFIIIASRSKPALNIGLMVFLIWLAWQYEYDAWALAVFYLGVLIAKYKNSIVTGLTNRGALFMILICMVAIFLYNNNYEFPGFIQKLQLPFKYSLSKYLMAIGSGLLIMLALAGKRITRFLEHRFFTFLGDISYSFYLIHAPILLTMASLFNNKYLLSPVYIFLSSLIIAVALAYGMFICIERPFQQIAKQLIAKYKILNSLGIN